MSRESMCMSWVEQLTEIEETFASFFDRCMADYDERSEEAILSQSNDRLEV